MHEIAVFNNLNDFQKEKFKRICGTTEIVFFDANSLIDNLGPYIIIIGNGRFAAEPHASSAKLRQPSQRLFRTS